MNENLNLNDKVLIWITGMIPKYEAQVVDFDKYGKPVLKVLNDASWEQFRLKGEDYIILEKLT